MEGSEWKQRRRNLLQGQKECEQSHLWHQMFPATSEQKRSLDSSSGDKKGGLKKQILKLY